MELTLYRDATGFDALHAEWNSLLARSRSDTLFLTWEWQTHWWACLAAGRWPLYLVAARQRGRLVGILPLYLNEEDGERRLQVVGCVEVSDYLDMIVESDQEQAVYSAFLDWLEGPDAPPWDVLDLCNQPAATLAHTLFPQLAEARGWSAEVFQEDVCPVVELPDTWPAYLENLDKKQRHEIRRKIRRIEREAPDYAVRVVTGREGLPASAEQFIRLHRRSRSDKDAFMTPEMQAFFHDIAGMAADAGWLRLAFLEIGDEPAAAYFCFAYGSDLLVYNSGYDPACYPQLSAGWVLLAHLIDQSIQEGLSRVDFLQGNEDYKYRFGGVDSPVYRTRVRPR